MSELYFTGDSNCLIFRNRLVDIPEFFARPIVSRQVFVTGYSLAASSVAGICHGRLVDYLKLSQIVPNSDVDFVALSKAERENIWFRNTHGVAPQHDTMNLSPAPPIVLFAGSVDIANTCSRFGPRFDFWFEDSRYDAAKFPATPRFAPTPLSLVDRTVEAAVLAFRTAVEDLIARGVANIYVHAIHPPTMDDDRYFAIRNVTSLARTRYKLALLINRKLAGIARDLHVGFIDPWNRTTSDGVLDSRLSLDGDHLNLDGARITVEMLLEEMLRKRGAGTEGYFTAAAAP